MFHLYLLYFKMKEETTERGVEERENSVMEIHMPTWSVKRG